MQNIRLHNLLYVILLSIGCSWSTETALLPQARYEYLFKIQVPSSATGLEPWIGYYHGLKLPFRGNLAIITEPSLRFTFSLIITPTLHHSNCCSISNMPILHRQADCPIKWFDLSLVMQEGAWTWNIVELEEEHMPITLPDHSITLLYDPSLVSVHQPMKAKYKKDTTHEGGRALIEFPTIMVSGSTEQIRTATQAAHCSALDVRGIHEGLVCKDRIIDGCCCTLIQ